MAAPLVLGIETSCDETGVGVVRGLELLADAVASSVAEHARFGGVVPEVASRAHLEAMLPTFDRALAIAGVQVGLFSTRWGLRTRAIGEHPVAADTVGIRVTAMRYRNVIAAGVLAGVGGAYLTIGSVGSFAKGMSSGEGYIALAAMIFGRYSPFGAIGAALLFGFSTQLQSILSTMNVPIQSNLLLATPYVVTIIVVAGLVGKVRPPKAEGVPYIKA